MSMGFLFVKCVNGIDAIILFCGTVFSLNFRHCFRQYSVDYSRWAHHLCMHFSRFMYIHFMLFLMCARVYCG